MAPTGRHRDADLIARSAPPSTATLGVAAVGQISPAEVGRAEPAATAGTPPGRLTAVTPVPGARDPKLAERVAAAIEADVLRAGWQVGMVIGSEEQLAVRYGVGRAVIREAIRLAEHRQVARMRRGRGGGLVVVKPDVSAVTESLAIYLEYAQVAVDDLLEARTVLEVFAAATAASSLDEEHLLALRRAAQEEGGAAHEVGGAALATALETPHIHELIAETTGNAALSLFIQAIVSLTAQMAEPAAATARPAPAAGTQPGPAPIVPSHAPIIPSHAAIVDAIAAGDALLARDRMREHMTALDAAVALPGGAAQLGRNGSGPVSPAGDGPPPYRPAGAVAARIRSEIVRRGWPVGESLGFEGDLLREYGIGRAQFREAIRILENHSVVRMQRGATGGMVVAVPDGRAVVRAVSLYLTYQGMNTEHVRDLREELEAATTRLAIERLDADGEARLTAIVELERTWPDETFRAVSHDLHAIIAELSGNRTLALLLSIVMQLTAERLHSANPNRVADARDAIRHAHHAIVEAMIARDVPLALRRVRKHLRALSGWTLESPAQES